MNLNHKLLLVSSGLKTGLEWTTHQVRNDFTNTIELAQTIEVCFYTTAALGMHINNKNGLSSGRVWMLIRII